MLKILKKYPNGIIEIDSGKKGKTISIIALTHGNEIAGLETIKYLLNEFDIKNKLKSGKINLIISNIKAAKLGKRFKDIDLNRVWGFDKKYKNTYEYNRAIELKKILLESDFVLDIHSTKSPSEPFAIPLNGLDKSFLDCLNVKYIVKNLVHFLHGIPLIEFVKINNEKAKCLVIESGQHSEKSTIKLSIENTLKFLEFYNFIEKEINLNKINKKYFKVFDVLYAKSLDIKFEYSNKPKSFDLIKKGEKILYDLNKTVIANEDLNILMPSIPEYVGREIGYLLKNLN